MDVLKDKAYAVSRCMRLFKCCFLKSEKLIDHNLWKSQLRQIKGVKRGIEGGDNIRDIRVSIK